jgi:hypothetical protein
VAKPSPAIHIIASVEAGICDIPLLLSGSKPSDTSSNLGSRNYGTRPVAVVVGGGFSDEAFAAMKGACGDMKAVWLRPDLNDAVQMPPLSEPERFGAATAVKVKKCLKGIAVGEGGEEEGVALF